MDNVRFQYTADERVAISGCAPRDLSADDWHKIETLAAAYQRNWLPTPSKKDAREIKRTAKNLELQLGQLTRKDSDAFPSCNLWSPEISLWLKSLRDLQAWAEKLQSSPKSRRKKSNRARPDVLDGYLIQIVQVFMSCGGHPGKAPTSPCANSVVAAAAPVLRTAHFELGTNAISYLIRIRVWFLAQDFSTRSPVLGTPPLTVHEHG